MGLLPSARKLFDEMEMKDVPTWNSLITGYAKNGNEKYVDALDVYKEMEKAGGVKPNEVEIASVLPICANLGALDVGEKIEVYARALGYFKNMFGCNAVLENYTKCVRIDRAMQFFHEIGRRRNLCSWNTMIMGLAVHGKSDEALKLFNQMLGEGNAPDDVTFVGAILACTHGGMAGRLQEAYDLIQSMPMRPDNVIWGTLLGACSFHGNVELAEQAVEFLSVLEPWNPGNYIILSNIYTRAGLWDGVARFRKLMKSSQIPKAAGYSFIEEGGDIHKFVEEDKSHPKSNEIYALLKSPLD
ncbi:Pentatricopeptide repeat-containing protein [Capsicum annuum]|nr:Pentatricopeptide repeat-containing protein [Capsicum annuum]